MTATANVPCRVCGVAFVQEHPRQTVCRVCVTPRCAVCCWHLTDAPLGSIYCGPVCRQRARAGSRYMVLGRDNFTCALCGFVGRDDDPVSLRRLDVFCWGDGVPTAGTAITVCRDCKDGRVIAPELAAEWERTLLKRNSFFGIRSDLPLRGLSRGEKRRFRRNHV